MSNEVEHVIQVFKANPGPTRGPLSISRTFGSAEAAQDFFERTITVHTAKANRNESGYYVVLGTREVGSSKKKREVTELRRWLCIPGGGMVPQ